MSAEQGKFDLIDHAHSFDVDLKHYEIYLMGIEDGRMFNDEDSMVIEPGVEYRLANRFIRNISILQSLDSSRPILIHMKTNGGDWHEGMAIYDAIKATPNPVTIVNYTHARSMSSIIFQAANKRIMMPNSTFMFHMGTWGDSGTWKQVLTAMEFDKRTEKDMIDIYVHAMKFTPGSKATNWGKPRIENWLREQMDTKEDVYLTANDAVSWGFADEIFTDWGSTVKYTKDQLKRK